MIKLIIAILSLCFINHFLYGAVDNRHSPLDKKRERFKTKISQLIEEQFSFQTDSEKQQFCPHWSGLTQRQILRAQLYQNFEEYQSDFNRYKDEVIQEIEKLQADKCHVIAKSQLYNEELLIKDYDFNPLKSVSESAIEENSHWRDLKVSQVSFFEKHLLSDDQGRDYQFHSLGVKGASISLQFKKNHNESFDFYEAIYSKEIRRYGQVSRRAEGARFFYDLNSSYFHHLKWGEEKYHFWGGLGVKLDQDLFLKKEQTPQIFTYERLSMFSLGLLVKKQNIFYEWPIEGKIFFYYKILAQSPNNVQLRDHLAFSLGGDLYYFPSIYMSYFMGMGLKYSKSVFEFSDLLGHNQKFMRKSLLAQITVGLKF